GDRQMATRAGAAGHRIADDDADLLAVQPAVSQLVRFQVLQQLAELRHEVLAGGEIGVFLLLEVADQERAVRHLAEALQLVDVGVDQGELDQSLVALLVVRAPLQVPRHPVHQAAAAAAQADEQRRADRARLGQHLFNDDLLLSRHSLPPSPTVGCRSVLRGQPICQPAALPSSWVSQSSSERKSFALCSLTARSRGGSPSEAAPLENPSCQTRVPTRPCASGTARNRSFPAATAKSRRRKASGSLSVLAWMSPSASSSICERATSRLAWSCISTVSR